MKIVITGAGRGLGLELTTQALHQVDTVMATAREPEKSEGLNALLKKFPATLQIVKVDITAADAPKRIASAIDSWDCLDVVINNAGILREGMTLDDFQQSFHVNSVAPLFITKALFAKLRKSKHPRAIHISSLMGSIDDNSSGGHYAYRASKTALNMINKCLAVEETWLTSTVFHPGWVQTDMGGSNAPTSVQESAAGLLNAMDNVEKEDSGCFYDFRGDKIAW